METNSIDSALANLSQTAKTSGGKIRAIIEEDFDKIQKVLTETGPEAQKALEELRASAKDSLNDSVTRVKKELQANAQSLDENVHQNPYMFIGIGALIAGLLGFILGRKS